MGKTNDTKHVIWASTLICITVLICGTLLYLNHNAWTMRFEMDDNTKEAIESIEFDEIANDGSSINLWISPSENWTMVTYSDNELYINGEKTTPFIPRLEPLDEVAWEIENE